MKGGISDSFKRAAVLWNVGRYLYDLEPVWVAVEPRGRSYAIRKEEYPRLDREYERAVQARFGAVPESPAQRRRLHHKKRRPRPKIVKPVLTTP